MSPCLSSSPLKRKYYFFLLIYRISYKYVYIAHASGIHFFVSLNQIFILCKMCMVNCAYAERKSFFADSNITGYIHTFHDQLHFFFRSRFYNILQAMLTQISVRLQKFASTIKLTFRRHIQWIFKLFSWCDARSIICLVKLNHRYRKIVLLRKYSRASILSTSEIHTFAFSRLMARIVDGDFVWHLLWGFVPTFIFLW